MKNVMKRVLILATVALMLLALASCGGSGDKSGAIKAAFEKEGYTAASVKYEDMNADVKAIIGAVLSENLVDKMANYQITVFSKKGDVLNIELPKAIVIKCDSADAVKDFLTVTKEDGTKDTTAYDEAVTAGLINGNCYLLSLDADAINLFKNA